MGVKSILDAKKLLKHYSLPVPTRLRALGFALASDSELRNSECNAHCWDGTKHFCKRFGVGTRTVRVDMARLLGEEYLFI